MNYDSLLKTADDMQLDVREKPLLASDGRIYGNRIAIRKDIPTTTEKACVLAEEICHYELNVGNILDQTDPANRRQEQKARTEAYRRMIGLQGLVDAFRAGCRNRYEAADYLGVTEQFLEDAVTRFHQIHGARVFCGQYLICFEPSFAVISLV